MTTPVFDTVGMPTPVIPTGTVSDDGHHRVVTWEGGGGHDEGRIGNVWLPEAPTDDPPEAFMLDSPESMAHQLGHDTLTKFSQAVCSTQLYGTFPPPLGPDEAYTVLTTAADYAQTTLAEAWASAADALMLLADLADGNQHWPDGHLDPDDADTLAATVDHLVRRALTDAPDQTATWAARATLHSDPGPTARHVVDVLTADDTDPLVHTALWLRTHTVAPLTDQITDRPTLATGRLTSDRFHLLVDALAADDLLFRPVDDTNDDGNHTLADALAELLVDHDPDAARDLAADVDELAFLRGAMIRRLATIDPDYRPEAVAYTLDPTYDPDRTEREQRRDDRLNQAARRSGLIDPNGTLPNP